MFMAQSIRRSQYITTYGPGAIIEGPNGPRLIPRPDIGLFQPMGLSPTRYEIPSQTMSTGLLGGARIFRLPSNAELHKRANYYVYRTRIFPSWALCVTHRILYFSMRGCPKCGGSPKGRQEAIRFVRACKRGHLDDVDWNYMVHKGKSCSNRDAFEWIGGGGALSELRLRCPECGARVHFGQAYNRDWPCLGRRPETEPFRSSPNRSGCAEPARIIQRQASNLRIPEIALTFTVPKRATRLHELLAKEPVLHALRAAPPDSLDQLQRMLERLVKYGDILPADMEEIVSHDFDEIVEVLDDVNEPVPSDPFSVYLAEFHSLIDNSIQGYPPVKSRISPSKVLFKVDPKSIRRFALFGAHKLRVVPIEILHAVMVQKGYRRLDPDPAQSTLVDAGFKDESDQVWYPGVELFGEGLFMILDETDTTFIQGGNAATKWHSLFENPSSNGYADSCFRFVGHPLELHPVFVWWHTLAHLMIRAIAVDSGYSGAAIRERVYVEANEDRAKGGIILYAVQQGADGTLGGMISLAPRFDRILQQVDATRSRCSNDPLCFEQEIRAGSYSGSSCYACLLLSETSCEHRNMWLDRKMLLGL
jgi:hypothetical protein